MSSLDRRFLKISLAVLGIANEPAANPTNGTQYIVGSSATGAFNGAAANSIASYDGSVWKFITPKVGNLEVLNLNTGEILKFTGTEWDVVASLGDKNIAPVTNILPNGATLPATAVEGDKFLKTDDAKIYTATATNTWDSGVLTANDSIYASSTDHKFYTSDGTTLTATDISDGSIFLNKADSNIYIYNATAGTFSRVNSDSMFEVVTESHTLTAEEVTAKSFNLANSIATGKENSVMLFIQGVAQAIGTDFLAADSSISWTNKGLDNIGLVAGDVFVIQYYKA